MLTFSLNETKHDIFEQGLMETEKPKSQKGIEWWGQAFIRASTRGTMEYMNADAYGYTSAKNELLHIQSKEVSILSDSELEGSHRGVSESVAKYIELNIDTIVESSEVQTLVAEFLEVQENFVFEEGINLWSVLQSARQQNSKAIDKLRAIIEEFNIGDLVSDLLNNVECLVALEEVFD